MTGQIGVLALYLYQQQFSRPSLFLNSGSLRVCGSAAAAASDRRLDDRPRHAARAESLLRTDDDLGDILVRDEERPRLVRQRVRLGVHLVVRCLPYLSYRGDSFSNLRFILEEMNLTGLLYKK